MRENVIVEQDQAGESIMWLRKGMLPWRTVCEISVALEHFDRTVPDGLSAEASSALGSDVQGRLG